MCGRKTAVLTTLCSAMEQSEKLDAIGRGEEGGGEKRGKCEHQREKIVDKFGFDSVYLSIFSFCLFWYVAWFRFGWVVFFIWHAGENWSKFKVGEIRTDARENDGDGRIAKEMFNYR